MLNARTPSPSLSGLAPDELDRFAPTAHDPVQRARFHDDACAALARAATENSGAAARSRAEREAIYSTLEQPGVPTRTRGGDRQSRPSKRKGIS